MNDWAKAATSAAICVAVAVTAIVTGDSEAVAGLGVIVAIYIFG